LLAPHAKCPVFDFQHYSKTIKKKKKKACFFADRVAQAVRALA
jgi:hypothetical protein